MIFENVSAQSTLMFIFQLIIFLNYYFSSNFRIQCFVRVQRQTPSFCFVLGRVGWWVGVITYYIFYVQLNLFLGGFFTNEQSTIYNILLMKYLHMYTNLKFCILISCFNDMGNYSEQFTSNSNTIQIKLIQCKWKLQNAIGKLYKTNKKLNKKRIFI